MSEPTIKNSISLMEIVGGYSACLILAAVITGVIALIIRRTKFSIFSVCVISGISLAGLGATFWELFAMHRVQLFGYGAIDPSMWQAEFGVSCASAGAVLPACGLALILAGISFLIPKKRQTNANKSHHATTGSGGVGDDFS